MKQESKPRFSDILPVPRSKQESKRFYDFISRFYDYLIGVIEQEYAELALKWLGVQEGETVLEIGFGTGHCLRRIAHSVGQTGKACGIDISSGMLRVTKRRLEKARLMDRVELCCGDAAKLPYTYECFDAAFMSFTLELFDTPEIPEVLKEIKRVLRTAGRLAVVSMSKEDGGARLLRLYEWAHQKWPKYVDCRPIYLESCLVDAGYEIQIKQKMRLIGLLPLEIVVAVKEG